MNNQILLSAENLCLQFGNEKVFEDLSFKINPFDKSVIVGPSGSGKTSLLNMIMGFTFPKSGKLLWKGEILSPINISLLRKNICWLPQEISVTVESVKEFVLLPFHFKHNKDRFPKTSEIFNTFNSLGLEEILFDKKINEISGGQKQRISIAICLLLKKQLILLDEPTSALDYESKERVADTILGNPELSILSVSHDDFWIDKCSHVINLKQTL